MNPNVSIEGRSGYLFETDHADNFCFVPTEHITAWIEGVAQLDELGYVQEKWSTRNMRWSYSEPNGRHLFPKCERPITDLSQVAVQEFLHRVSDRTSHPFAQ